MRFSPALIERLRSHFLVSEVVGKRIPIKKHGREYHGLCPFHNEKSPSFTVNDEKGFFHCFGCGAHGDSIEFVRRYERVSYPDAVESLARSAGIEIAAPSPEEHKKIEQEKTLYDVCEAACVWFEKQLLAPSGMLASDYVERRGIRADTIRQFRIGYAPDEKTALHQHLLSLGFPKKLQAEAGLISISESGSVYDRFRGRVIFPIRSSTGKVVAFGGRLMGGGDASKNLPKYLNSPETPLFKKGEMLYNLDQAKRPARDGNMVVVMEGYMDVVMTVQAGVNYGVATLGTAVTPEHLRLLWQLAKEPVMCLDGDAAGKRAMLRAADVALPILKPSFSLRFAVLPEGEDPDSYIQKQGKAAFEKTLLTSRRLSQVLWDNMAQQYNVALPEGMAALDDDCQKTAAKISDTTVRQHYLSHFRKELWAASSALKNAAQKGFGKQAAAANQAQARTPQVGQMFAQHHTAALETLIQRLLNTVLQFPALLHKGQVEETISRLDIRSPALQAIRVALLSAAISSDIDDMESFSAYMRSQIADEVLTENLKLPYKETLTEHDANMLWGETIAVYEVARLEFEYKELQENITGEVAEEDYLRLIELQNAVQKARANRTFAPAESDVA